MLQRSGRPLARCLERAASVEAQNLSLPFLCPQLLPSAPQRRTVTSNTKKKSTSTSERQVSRHHVQQQQQRASFVTNSSKLATAATSSSYSAPGEDPIPFGPPPTSPYSEPLKHGPDQIPPLHGFDLNPSPLILNDTPVTSIGRYHNLLGVSGDINEIHQTLHACLQVGRFERAAALVRRLSDSYKPDAPGLLAAHTDYLREATLDVIRSKDADRLQELLDWFENDVRKRKVPLSEMLLGYMIHACMQVPNEVPKSKGVGHLYRLSEEEGMRRETESVVADLQEAVQNPDWDIDPKQDLRRDIVITAEDLSETNAPVKLREVKLKGEGLRALRKSLGFLHGPVEDSNGQIVDVDKLSDLEKQRLLEKTAADAALYRWRIENEQLKKIGISSSFSEKSPVGAMMWAWYEQLVPAIREELRLMDESDKKDPKQRNAADHERVLCGPYLQQISPEKAAAVTLITVMSDLTLHGEAKLAGALTHLTSELQIEIHRNRDVKDNQGAAWRNVNRQYTNSKDRRIKSAFKRFDFASAAINSELQEWPQNVRFKIGAKLLSRLSKVAKVDIYRNDAEGKRQSEAHPAIFHTFQYVNGKKTGMLRLNKALEAKLQKEPLSTALAKYLPMLCEPRQWQSWRQGGFLSQDDSVVRMYQTDPYSVAYLKAASKNGDLEQVFAGLNVLGKVPWIVNRSVFDVMAEVWNLGEEFATFPSANPTVVAPPQPDPADRKAHTAWASMVTEMRHHNNGLKSKRAFQNFQLEVARAFLGRNFYFPHNFDFRGRAYPMPPILNHMGADSARGLLMFAEGKKLGQSGLWWLKVHLANLYGFDKASFEERSKFADDHLEDVRDAATNPLKGRRWWLKAEDPWQCLAVCFELNAALELPDPTEFVSHIPVHQDGTCNGLQHYAALGGDKIGAQQVNLEPGSRPADIYSHVARMIDTEIESDAAGGNEFAQLINGKISRKVVKQTVMTNVYGVTVRGARDQVSRQLESIFPITPVTSKKQLDKVGHYVAVKIFKVLSNMFEGAHDIQLWFGQCANRICESISPRQLALVDQSQAKESAALEDLKKPPRLTSRSDNPLAFMTPVVWTTPLKLPVVQPYRQQSLTRCTTEMQVLQLGSIDGASPVHKQRQLQGFPPNFIHSLDGTHMLLTALRSDQLGLTFAAVHDSFWTHACDIDTMNRVTRDAFIRMHAEDVIARLAAEFVARYKGHVRLTRIPSTHPAAGRIAQWRRENRTLLMQMKVAGIRALKGKAKMPGEMVLEGRRVRLLESEDEGERRRGREMVTPGSILEEVGEEAAVKEVEVTVQGLGQASAEGVAAGGKVQEEMQEEEEEEVMVEEEEEVEEAATEGETRAGSTQSEGKKKKKSQPRTVTLWTGLKFPPLPKKGEFDIRRLKDSLYFFS